MTQEVDVLTWVAPTFIKQTLVNLDIDREQSRPMQDAAGGNPDRLLYCSGGGCGGNHECRDPACVCRRKLEVHSPPLMGMVAGEPHPPTGWMGNQDTRPLRVFPMSTTMGVI